MDPSSLSSWQWAALVLVTFAAAVLQGTIGFGYAVFAVPLLSLVDPRLVPIPQMLSAFPLTVLAMRREHQAINYRSAFWLLLGRLPGSLLGAVILSLLPASMLDLLIGSIVLLAALILSSPIKLKRSPLVDFGASTFGSVCGYVSAIGGPPIALLFRDEKGPTIRSTLGFVFAVGIVVSITVRAASNQLAYHDVVLGLLLVPVVIGGVGVSRYLLPYVDQGPVLSRSILLVSAIAACLLLLRAL